MELKQTLIKNNDCYKAGRTITPKGVMVHSTATPGVMASDWYSRWNKPNIEKAVHAFVDDQFVCQHLPWNHRAWHCGDSGNNTHISFEMCEPKDWTTNKEYAKKCYDNAVELAAWLCKTYNISTDNVISHKEGHQKGIASNHGDPDHWWKYFGFTMNQFRADVKKRMTLPIYINVIVQRETVRKGSTGDDVVYLQKRLNVARKSLKIGYSELIADGVFGNATYNAVKAFQKARKLTVDGVVGDKTWSALDVNYGDVDGDGKISATDAQEVLKATVGKTNLTDKQKKAADMDADGKVGAADAQEILKRTVGK